MITQSLFPGTTIIRGPRSTEHTKARLSIVRKAARMGESSPQGICWIAEDREERLALIRKDRSERRAWERECTRAIANGLLPSIYTRQEHRWNRRNRP